MKHALILAWAIPRITHSCAHLSYQNNKQLQEKTEYQSYSRVEATTNSSETHQKLDVLVSSLHLVLTTKKVWKSSGSKEPNFCLFPGAFCLSNPVFKLLTWDTRDLSFWTMTSDFPSNALADFPCFFSKAATTPSRVSSCRGKQGINARTLGRG